MQGNRLAAKWAPKTNTSSERQAQPEETSKFTSEVIKAESCRWLFTLRTVVSFLVGVRVDTNLRRDDLPKNLT